MSVEPFEKVTEGLTDSYIRDNACATKICRFWAASGYTLCERCLHGAPRKLTDAVYKRKLELEQN